MAHTINLQDLVKHIVNGSLEESLCQICLMPLGENYHYISTRIPTDDNMYCIADVLEQVCDIKVSEKVEYKICSNCFIAATQTYKFYQTAQKSQKIIDFYVNEINRQLESSILDDITSNCLCITLPSILSNDGITNSNQPTDLFETRSAIYDLKGKEINGDQEKIADTESDHDFIVVFNNKGAQEIYKQQKDGTLIPLENKNEHIKDYLNQTLVPDVKLNPDTDVKRNQLLDSNVKSRCSPDSSVKMKRGRKRNLMEYKKCSQCPVQYRFVRKLKAHMKEEHSIDLFVCQVCQALVEGEKDFTVHLQTHTGIHTCSTCNMVFKKRETIISHFKWHEQMRAMTQSDAAHVCEVCGLIFRDGEDLKEHHDKKHVKKFTCYYCGRMYKGELSFELHIKKHESQMTDVKQDQGKSKLETSKRRKRKFTCGTCGKDFVDERALLWHERLHTNERPYACDVCGRGFVSLNRRNQHAVCAHTAPARRCPLCPALFHLRSMVNTHIKKVHLKAHKRPNRTSRYQNVFWKTEPVPIQELSVSIQNDILELQAQRSRQGAEW